MDILSFFNAGTYRVAIASCIEGRISANAESGTDDADDEVPLSPLMLCVEGDFLSCQGLAAAERNARSSGPLLVRATNVRGSYSSRHSTDAAWFDSYF